MMSEKGSKKKQPAEQQPLLGIDIEQYSSSYQNDGNNNSAPFQQHTGTLTARTSSDPMSNPPPPQSFPNPAYYSPTASLRQPLLSQVINLKQKNTNNDFLLSGSDEDNQNPLHNNNSDYIYTSQIPPHNPAANYTFIRNRPEEEWPNIHTLSKNAKSLLSKGAKKTQRRQPVAEDAVFDDLDYICIGSAVILSIVWLVLYLTQPELDQNSDTHGNTLHAYLGIVVLTITVYYTSALLELYTIHFLWLLNNSRFWKLYYYGQVLNRSFKWLVTLIFIYYIHHYNIFITLPPSTLRFLDPTLTFIILCITAGMVRQFWIKLVTYRMNATTYSTLVEEMYFKHNVLKRLANPRSYYQIVRPIHNQQQQQQSAGTGKPSGMSRSTSSGTLAVLQTKREEQAEGQNVQGSGFTQFFSALRVSHHDSDETPVPVGSEHFSKKIKATALARKVFNNVDRQNKGYIIASDFQNFLPEKTAISAFDMIIHSVIEEQAAGRGLSDDAGEDDSGENESTKAKPPTPFQLHHIENEQEMLKQMEQAQSNNGDTTDPASTTTELNNKQTPDAANSDNATSDRSVSFAPDTNLTSPASSPIVKPADLPIVPASSANRASSRATTAATLSPSLQQQQPQAVPIQRAASTESTLQNTADNTSAIVPLPADKSTKPTTKTTKKKKKIKSALSASNAANNQSSSITSVTGDTIDIGSYRLTEKQLTTVVLRYYKDYKKLLDTIRNTNGLSSVIDSLSQMFYWIVVTFAMTIAFNQYYKQQNFVITLSTVFFSLTFVFSQSLRDMFTAIVFLFYLKPYAVGDRVDVGTAKYRVVSIQLLTTTFRTLDSRVTTMPNSSLASATITNLSKSKQAVAKWSFFVEMNTSCSKLAQLRQRLVTHIEANPKDWASNVSMNFNNVLPNTNSLQISLWLKSKHFYTDGYSGAEMVALCRTAAMSAMEEDVNIAAVSMRHFDSAIQHYKPRTTQQTIEWYENYGTQNRTTQL